MDVRRFAKAAGASAIFALAGTLTGCGGASSGEFIAARVTPTPVSSALPSASPPASPTPTPAANPTPTPPATTPGALSVAPTAQTFTAVGAAAMQTFHATESGYAGTVGEADNCTGIATITPSGTSTGSNVAFNVTPAAAGSCTVTVSDSFLQTATVSISVTTTGLGIQ